MKRFILSLLGLVALFALCICVTYVVMIYRAQPKLDEIYSLPPEQDILFVGSSQIGCGVRRLPKYHHKLIWYMTSTFPEYYVHLQELERRHQLDHVKILIMNLSVQSAQTMTPTWVERVYHRAFPLFWKYMDQYPGDYLSFVRYAMVHLTETMVFAVSDVEAAHSPISELPPAQLEKYRANEVVKVKERTIAGNVEGWERSVCEAMKGIMAICKKHDLVVYTIEMPILPLMEANLAPWEFEVLSRLVAFSESIGMKHLRVDGFDESDFMDDVHLSTSGSEKFMHKLYRQLGLKINE